MDRPILIRRSHVSLAVYILCIGAILIFSHTIFGGKLTRQVGYAGLYSWSALIPIAVVALWILNWHCRKAHSPRQRVWMAVSHVLLLFAWLYSCLHVLVYAAINEPWPISRKHGPDTDFARAGFSQHAGFAPPPSVKKIYYRNYIGWERHERLRFQTSDPGVVQRFVRRHNLAETQKGGMRYVSFERLHWWRTTDRKTALKYYYREEYRAHWLLWFDPTGGIVWFEIAGP